MRGLWSYGRRPGRGESQGRPVAQPGGAGATRVVRPGAGSKWGVTKQKLGDGFGYVCVQPLLWDD